MQRNFCFADEIFKRFSDILVASGREVISSMVSLLAINQQNILLLSRPGEIQRQVAFRQSLLNSKPSFHWSNE